VESISICNAKKTADIFIISGMMKLRITNAYIHTCRIANSAGRSVRPPLAWAAQDGGCCGRASRFAGCVETQCIAPLRAWAAQGVVGVDHPLPHSPLLPDVPDMTVDFTEAETTRRAEKFFPGEDIPI
jgi:hypothetical protein